MKARLYHDTRKEIRDSIDAWSMYFPYPKWLRKENKGVFGCYISCKPTEYGAIICCCYYDEVTPGHGRPYLGKRVDVRTTPKAFQKIFRHQEYGRGMGSMEQSLKEWSKISAHHQPIQLEL